MFQWVRQLFCKHDFTEREYPVLLKRWVDSPHYMSEAQAMENGHWEYHRARETEYFCKKCGYTKTVTR